MSKNTDNHYYNKNLRNNANVLRKNMTKAEACLWKYALRAGQMHGYSFRRQRPVLHYIADFMCPELWLIIEVDGYSHQLQNVIVNDMHRQQTLEQAGFTVLRFTDSQVLNQINDVISTIARCIEQCEQKIHPLPPPAGDITALMQQKAQ